VPKRLAPKLWRQNGRAMYRFSSIAFFSPKETVESSHLIRKLKNAAKVKTLIISETKTAKLIKKHYIRCQKFINYVIKVGITRHLEGDLVDDISQGSSTFLDLLHLVVREFLVEDRIDAILSDNHRHTEKHFFLYPVITLHTMIPQIT